MTSLWAGIGTGELLRSVPNLLSGAAVQGQDNSAHSVSPWTGQSTSHGMPLLAQTLLVKGCEKAFPMEWKQTGAICWLEQRPRADSKHILGMTSLDGQSCA